MEAIQKFLNVTIFKFTKAQWWSPWAIGTYFAFVLVLAHTVPSINFIETTYVLYGFGIVYIVTLYGQKIGLVASVIAYILFNLPLLVHRVEEYAEGPISFFLEGFIMPLSFFALSHYIGKVLINSQRSAEETQSLNYRLLELNQQAEQTLAGFMVAMSRAIESKDPYTKGHSERVACYSMLIAEKLNLACEQRKHLFYGALLHDIGKIGVPDSVLLKPGKLDPDEWVEMQLHPAVGKIVLEAVSGVDYVLDPVAMHHENLDGTGYPYGYKEQQIPLSARIVSIADSFDAMTSDRPYRKGKTPQHAIEELNRNKGNRYDPKLVDIFVAAICERDYRLMENEEFTKYFYEVSGFQCGIDGVTRNNLT